MATNKLLHFKTQNRFNEAVLNDEIPEDSIAFIQEGTEVYTHSTLYAHYDEHKDGDYNMNNCLNPGIYYGCTLGRPIGSAEDEYYALRVSNLGKKIEDTEIPIRPANYNWKFNHDQVIEGYCNYDFNEERFSLFYGIVDPQTSRPTEYNELWYSQVQQNSQANSSLLFYMDCDLPKPGEYYIKFEIAALNTRLQNEQGIPPVVSDSYVDVYIVYYEDDQLVRIPYKVYTKERYADDRGTVVSYEDITTIYERIACSTNKIRVEVRLRERSNANWFLFKKKELTLIEPEMDVIEQICTSKVLDHQYRRILYTTDRSQYESPFTLYEEWHSMTEHLDRAFMSCELSKYDTNWYLNFYDKAGVQRQHVYMPNATTTIAGLMTGLDKQHLDTAYEVLGTSESAQGVIDKFNEVKEFLEGITVDETLIDLLNGLTPIAYIGDKANNNGAQKSDQTYLNVVTDYAKRSLVLGDGNEILVHDVAKSAYYPWNVVIEGANNKSDAMQSHVEGKLNSAVWDVNGAMRRANYGEALITKYNLTDDADFGADCAHAEGYRNVASGWISHVEGNKNVAAGRNSHAEGHGTLAAGSTSHAEGRNTIARGPYSHAQGNATEANGASSFAAGKGTIANNEAETAFGQYNNPGHLFSVGIGTSDSDRKNVIEADNAGVKLLASNSLINFSDVYGWAQTALYNLAFTEGTTHNLRLRCFNQTSHFSIDVPQATTARDGVMSKEDKSFLDSAANGIDVFIDTEDDRLKVQLYHDSVEGEKVIIPRATSTTEGVMSAEDKTKLDSLKDYSGIIRDMMSGYKVEFTVNPTIVHRNTAHSFVATATYPRTFKVDSITYTGAAGIQQLVPSDGVGTSVSLTKTLTPSDNIIFTATTKIDDAIEVIKSATVRVVDKIYYGFTSNPTIFIGGGGLVKPATTVYKDTYSDTSTGNADLFFILLPTTIVNEDITQTCQFTMGGAPVAMVKDGVITIDGATYNVYRTAASYTSGTTLNITIS